MIKQGFHVGDRDWWVMVYYGVDGTRDLKEVYETLMLGGSANDAAQRACMVLSREDTGYTFTNFVGQYSLIFISRTSSAEQMYDTIQHELKHVVEHISEYYGVDPQGETSAHLQGEIARLMFPAAALAVCPKCNE